VVVGFGHLGDGNLHLNVQTPTAGGTEAAAQALALVEPYIFEWSAVSTIACNLRYCMNPTSAIFMISDHCPLLCLDHHHAILIDYLVLSGWLVGGRWLCLCGARARDEAPAISRARKAARGHRGDARDQGAV
jgi:hypothetical protein